MPESKTFSGGQVELKLNNKEFEKVIDGASKDGLRRATTYLHSQLLLTLNVPNTGVSVQRKRGTGSYTIYPSPSKPGEPPRKRTGFLQSNVLWEELDDDNLGFATRVGVTRNAIYGLYLELGTRFMAARPWLVSTTIRLAPILKRLILSEARGEK